MLEILFFLIALKLILNMAQTYAHELKVKKVSIGHGFAQSFIHFNYHNEPSSVGIILSQEALDGLSNTDQSYSLNMPASAPTSPYKEIYINWNAHGHEPTGIYDIPHFDFHFYGISKKERENIMCTGTDAEICMRMPDQNGHYPKKYTVNFDATKNVYRIVLQELVLRDSGK